MAAKVKFFIRTIKSNSDFKEDVNIRVRFSNGRQFDLTAITQKQINTDFWNNEKGIVKQRAAFEGKKEFQKDLNKLKRHILDKFDEIPDKSKVNN